MWGTLQTAFHGFMPKGLDKVKHFSTYLFLAVWFMGLLHRPRYWIAVLCLLGFGLSWKLPSGQCTRAAPAILTTWPPTPRAYSWACCLHWRLRAAGRNESRHGWPQDKGRGGRLAVCGLPGICRAWVAGGGQPARRRGSRSLATAGRSHASRDARRVRRPGAPAGTRQAAATPARRPQPAFDDPVGTAWHRQDDAGATCRAKPAMPSSLRSRR